MVKEHLTHISLFTGAGGLDIGLHHAGFETKLCVENNLECRSTLEANRVGLGNSEFAILGDLTRLSPGQLLEHSGLEIGKVDLISGGPPCQSFSRRLE